MSYYNYEEEQKAKEDFDNAIVFFKLLGMNDYQAYNASMIDRFNRLLREIEQEKKNA